MDLKSINFGSGRGSIITLVTIITFTRIIIFTTINTGNNIITINTIIAGIKGVTPSPRWARVLLKQKADTGLRVPAGVRMKIIFFGSKFPL